MKHFICLFAAMSLALGASAQKASEQNNGSSGSSYSEGGYERPGGDDSPLKDAVKGFLDLDDTADGDAAAKDAAGTDGKLVGKAAPGGSVDLNDELAKLIKEACRYGVFVIRQPYGGTDNDGYIVEKEEGNPELGVSYSVAYYIKGGYLFTDRAMRPWKYDKEMQQYIGVEFNPNLLDTTKAAYLSSKATFITKTFNKDKAGNVYPGYLYSMPDNSDLSSDGFIVKREKGELDGYLVWLIITPNQDLSKDTDLSLTIDRKRITVGDKPEEFHNLGTGYTNAVGAFYIVPEVTGVGQLSFAIHGIGVQKDNAWQLVFPFGKEGTIFDKEQLVKATEDKFVKPSRRFFKSKREQTDNGKTGDSTAVDNKADAQDANQDATTDDGKAGDKPDADGEEGGEGDEPEIGD